MGKIFISYRREDTAAFAGRLYDRLTAIVGVENLFFDINTIGGGEDFAQTIARAMQQSDAVVVLIGEKWLDRGTGGRGRLWDEGDFVRTEVRTALVRPKLLPVLVGDSRMPTAADLPEDIRDILSRNALRIRHESFDADVARIAETLLGRTDIKSAPSGVANRLGSVVSMAIGCALAGVSVIVVGLVHLWVFGRPLESSIGLPGVMLLFLLSMVLGLGFGWHFRAPGRRRFPPAS